jgi:hypothetical protein
VLIFDAKKLGDGKGIPRRFTGRLSVLKDAVNSPSVFLSPAALLKKWIGGPSRTVKKNLLFFTSYKYLPFVLADAYLYISRIPGLIAGASVPSF